jgi:homoserine O-acetyltransferase
MADYEIYELGDVWLSTGQTLRNAKLAYKTYAIVMPAEKDLYFPPEDEEFAVSHMPDAELRVIPGAWGHLAGGGVNPTDTAFIDQALKELLASWTRRFRDVDADHHHGRRSA